MSVNRNSTMQAHFCDSKYQVTCANINYALRKSEDENVHKRYIQHSHTQMVLLSM